MDQSLSGRVPAQWDNWLERLRKQLPPAPEELLTFYVRWMPWVAIVLGAIALVFLLLGGLLFAVASPFLLLAGPQGVLVGFVALITLALGVVEALIGLVGGWQMRQMKANGWWLIAASLVIGFILQVLSFRILLLLIYLGFGYVHLLVKPRYQ